MKRAGLLFFFILICHKAFSQLPEAVKDRLEKYIENAETEDDYTILVDQLMQYYEQPIHLNTCTLEELMQFPLIEPLQAVAIVNHRKQFGEFIHIAELQVTGIEVELIQLIRPFISVELSNAQKFSNFLDELKHGNRQLVSTAKLSAPSTLPAEVRGTKWNHNLRFRYFGERYSIGFSADKDAGEQYWNKGPDFYSGHLAIKKTGKLHYAVLGDYVLHFGQGLVLGSGLGMGKGANVMNVKRGRQPLREYRGINEYQFFRGAAAQFNLSPKFQLLLAASVNKVDASVNLDSLKNVLYFSNFDVDGYHRTTTELSKKGNIEQRMGTAFLQYNRVSGNFSACFSRFNYSGVNQSYTNLYQLHYPQGSDKTYLQFAQNHTLGNIHLFSEWAYEINSQKKSMIAGVFIPLGTKIETVVLFRNYDPGFMARYNTAFGQNGQNERGLYTGIKYTINRRLWISVFQDMYLQPWLQYTTDGPAYNTDAFIQVDKQFTKKSGAYLRVRQLNSVENEVAETTVQQVYNRNTTQVRLHIKNEINTALQLEVRAEGNLVQLGEKTNYKGSLLFFEITTRAFKNRVNFNTRFTVFNIDNYNNRMYAFENQLLYDFSSVAFYGKGTSFYLLANVKLNRRWKIAFRYSQTGSLKPGEQSTATKQTFGLQLINQIR